MVKRKKERLEKEREMMEQKNAALGGEQSGHILFPHLATTGDGLLTALVMLDLIDMLDALHEKTKGNLAPEEDGLLLDLLGKLKMTYLEINQAMAAEMAKAQGAIKGKK